MGEAARWTLDSGVLQLSYGVSLNERSGQPVRVDLDLNGCSLARGGGER
jgi:hypothetical protein